MVDLKNQGTAGDSAPYTAVETGLTGRWTQTQGFVLDNLTPSDPANGVSAPASDILDVAAGDDAVLLWAGVTTSFPDILAIIATIGDTPVSTGVATPQGDPLYTPLAAGNFRLTLPRSQP
jgi:hypothetical protein